VRTAHYKLKCLMLLFGALCSAFVSTSSASYIAGSIRSSQNDGSEVSLHIDDGNNMEIVVKGPADRWFSFGFGSNKMQDTYAIIVAGDSITEHSLDMMSTSQADTLLPRATITVYSDVTEGEYRTVTLSRSSTTINNIFETDDLHVISASADPHGSSYETCSYHGRNHRASDVLKLVEYGDSGSNSNTGSGASSKSNGGGSRESRERSPSMDSGEPSGGGSGGRSPTTDKKSVGPDSTREEPGGRSEEMVKEINCVWNGEVKGSRSDEVVMHYQCGQLTERECITGGPLGQCEWVGVRHKLEIQLAVDAEDGNVPDTNITAMVILVAVAFFVAAAFAVELCYEWWTSEMDGKWQELASDTQPLLV